MQPYDLWITARESSPEHNKQNQSWKSEDEGPLSARGHAICEESDALIVF